MKTINFFGGPGAGKSTAAAGLFHEMKKHWMEAEYVQEYAKELVLANSAHMLSEQNLVFAEQEHRLNRLRKNNKVVAAIADSPLLLSSFYAPTDYPASFDQLVFDLFHTYDNINIFVQRSHEYSLEGRLQSEEQADIIAHQMRRYLHNNGISYWSITASNAAPTRLLAWLVETQGVPLPKGMTLAARQGPRDWLVHYPAPQPWRRDRPIVRPDLSGVTTVGRG